MSLSVGEVLLGYPLELIEQSRNGEWLEREVRPLAA